MKSILPALLLMSLAPGIASAQVVISEVYAAPPNGQNAAQWVELHNIGERAIALEGYALSDYLDDLEESPVRWMFPATTSLGPDQVLVIARQAAAFSMIFGLRADHELADGADASDVPNLHASNGTDALRLSTRRTGDAVVLRDSTGAIVDAVEWGTLDRPVPGIPISTTLAAGQSYVRVRRKGSSQLDFVVSSEPSPGVGFTPARGPSIASIEVQPAHVDFAGRFSVEARIIDGNGLGTVEIALATSTSSRGEAAMLYAPVAMTLIGSAGPAGATYRFEGDTARLGPGLAFPEPETFHARYLRYFLYAEDVLGGATTDPLGAAESSTNGAFHQHNVLPPEPSPIADVRAQDLEARVRWPGHSAKVRGVVIAGQGVFGEGLLDLALEDVSQAGIRVLAMGTSSAAIQAGDVIEVVGEIGQSHGLTILASVGEDVRRLGTGGLITTTTVTAAELLAQADALESRLVLVRDVHLVGGEGAWGRGHARISDGTGEIAVEVRPGNVLFGQPIPAKLTLRGVVAQRTEAADGTAGGYFLVPRGPEDIFVPSIPDDGAERDDIAASGGERGDEEGLTSGPGTVAESCGCSAAGADRGGAPGLALGLAVLGFIARLSARRGR